jgi:hypothetical protein
MAFKSPARPAVGSVCPRFAFTEPTTSGRSFDRPRKKVSIQTVASVLSPAFVPVPNQIRLELSSETTVAVVTNRVPLQNMYLVDGDPHPHKPFVKLASGPKPMVM